MSPKKPSLSDGEKARMEEERKIQEAQQAKAEAERVAEAQRANAQATRDLQRKRGFASLLTFGNGGSLGGGGSV